jgi:hypothetical protein
MNDLLKYELILEYSSIKKEIFRDVILHDKEYIEKILRTKLDENQMKFIEPPSYGKKYVYGYVLAGMFAANSILASYEILNGSTDDIRKFLNWKNIERSKQT